MKYNQFIELTQDDDPYEVSLLCLKYLKEVNYQNKTMQALCRIAKKELNSEYLLPDIIKLLSHCEREGY
jgi:hypothetical protein